MKSLKGRALTEEKKTKYIFITGGVVSSLGKGITAASVGRLLKSRGLRVSIQKLDPYINVDPGTMNPYQHGEVFVTEDGAETDLDLGHYERFIDVPLGKVNNVTTGMVYWTVLQKERRGDFLGGTVQVVPHITNEIKDRIRKVTKEVDFDVVICEVGGTVGDIESLPFLEAIRQFTKEAGRDNVIHIHVTLVPYLNTTQEFKTKPTQHSVKELRAIGIHPEIIICRSTEPLNSELKEKIALFCDTDKDAVIGLADVKSIYEVPLELQKEKLDEIIIRYLRLDCVEEDLSEWKSFLSAQQSPTSTVKIALVGKYVELGDAYISVVEALKHAGFAAKAKIDIKWINSEKMEADADLSHLFGDVHGIVIPGGFGSRGIEGKITAIKYARENKIPFLGLCLGMQCAVIEFARHVCNMDDANSTEFNPKTAFPIIDYIPDQRFVKDMGGTMRLGAYPCKIKPGTKLFEAYGEVLISERHRHRYEVNNELRAKLEAKGMVFSGIFEEADLVEVAELSDHPFFVGSQFHPEFKSRPNRPHPLFREFVKTAVTVLGKQENLF